MKGFKANKVRQRGAKVAVAASEACPMSKSIAAVALVAGMLSLPGSVQAGGYDGYYYGGGYEGGGYDVPYPPRGPLPPVAIRQAPILPPPQYAPPVYGWVFIPPPAPPSCGQWGGDQCLDARYTTPYVGARW
jgi:hypothetical protein